MVYDTYQLWHFMNDAQDDKYHKMEHTSRHINMIANL